MWKRIRTAASEAVQRRGDAPVDKGEHADSAADAIAADAPRLDQDDGPAAEEGGPPTPETASSALSNAGTRLKAAGAVVGAGVRRTGTSIKNAAQSAASGAATVGGGVAGSATELGAKAWEKVDLRLESCWTVIQDTFIETAGNAIHSAVSNDAAMERLFKAVYITLPKQLRVWLLEEHFLKFCFKNRDRLVGAALAAPTPSEVRALPAANDARVVDI